MTHVLEYLRPDSISWDGDGAMSHDETMRSLRLMGEEVLPAVHEMAKNWSSDQPFEMDPATGQPVADPALTSSAAPMPGTGCPMEPMHDNLAMGPSS